MDSRTIHFSRHYPWRKPPARIRTCDMKPWDTDNRLTTVDARRPAADNREFSGLLADCSAPARLAASQCLLTRLIKHVAIRIDQRLPASASVVGDEQAVAAIHDAGAFVVEIQCRAGNGKPMYMCLKPRPGVRILAGGLRQG